MQTASSPSPADHGVRHHFEQEKPHNLRGFDRGGLKPSLERLERRSSGTVRGRLPEIRAGEIIGCRGCSQASATGTAQGDAPRTPADFEGSWHGQCPTHSHSEHRHRR